MKRFISNIKKKSKHFLSLAFRAERQCLIDLIEFTRLRETFPQCWHVEKKIELNPELKIEEKISFPMPSKAEHFFAAIFRE